MYTRIHSCHALLTASALFAWNVSQAQEQPSASTDSSDILVEVLVTAQKRSERLQDVPIPVSALSSESLVENNQLRVQDFFAGVPGLNLQQINNRSSLAIRGLTTGARAGNPVVGYTVDDAPYGSSVGGSGIYSSAPDLNPVDLARIEVLRGPQGTLYGASSIGGLLKYVTIAPSMAGFNGKLQGGTTYIEGGSSAGYDVSGAVNVPISSSFAMRFSGSARKDPGYIDNVRTGVRDVNEAELYGGRVAALWEPGDSFSVLLNAMIQNRKVDGAPTVDATLGRDNFKQSDAFLSGSSEWETRFFSANVNAEVGRFDITSVTAYAESPSTDWIDFTYNFAPVYQRLYGNIPLGAPFVRDYETKKFSEELRVATTLGERADLLLGAFYTHEKTPFHLYVFATTPETGEIREVSLETFTFNKYEEAAVFADLTFHFTDRFDLQVGARQADLTIESDGAQVGRFVGLTTMTPTPHTEAKADAFTYLVAPRFRISPDLMVYGRVATGYRPGGANGNVCIIEPTVPCTYEPDETKNYEIGTKGNLVDGRFSFDVSLYYIDWKDFVLGLRSPVGRFPYNGNGGKAKSQGLEFALEYKPLGSLTFGLTGSWGDADLRDPFPADAALYASAGDRLPYASRVNGKFTVDMEHPLAGNVVGFAGAAVSYVGDRQGEFVGSVNEAALRQRYPSYAQIDLRTGVQYDTWRINLLARNVADKRGVIGGGYLSPTTYNPNWFYYIQPRTFSLSVEKSF